MAPRVTAAAPLKVVIPSNLRTQDFSVGGEFPNFISVTLGQGLIRGADGKWKVDAAFLADSTTNALAVAGTNLTSTVNGEAATVNLAPLVDAAIPDAVVNVAYNSTTGVWTITKNNGVTETLSTPVEKFLSSSDYDAATNILTLTMADGTDFDIDLTDLVDAYAMAGGDTTTVTGNGSTATPWKVEAKLNPVAGNLLTSSPAGLAVSPASLTLATTNTLTLAGNVLTSTVNGKVATSPTIATNTLIAGTAPGSIRSTVNGVASADLDLGAVVRPLADVEVQDAFGVAQYFAFSTNV